jgi:hypothetical protein
MAGWTGNGGLGCVQLVRCNYQFWQFRGSQQARFWLDGGGIPAILAILLPLPRLTPENIDLHESTPGLIPNDPKILIRTFLFISGK